MRNSGQKASLKISRDVIETIARVAALEVEGVADIGMPTAWNRKPVDIKVVDGIAEISIAIILEFGSKINETCYAVQKSVKENVQTMTSVMVSKVNIAVEGVDIPAPSPKAESNIQTIQIDQENEETE